MSIFSLAAVLCLLIGSASAAEPAPAPASARVSTSASAEAEAPPAERAPLDIEAIKKSVREDPELTAETPKPFPNQFSGGPPRNKRFEEQMRRAIPRDCRTAYSGLGLLALIPLAYSTVTGIGCKW